MRSVLVQMIHVNCIRTLTVLYLTVGHSLLSFIGSQRLYLLYCIYFTLLYAKLFSSLKLMLFVSSMQFVKLECHDCDSDCDN